MDSTIGGLMPYIVGGGILALMFILLIAYKAFYRKVAADNALVVSGGKRKRAYFGGKLINPITCKTMTISLNTMNLAVTRAGPDALITKDSLRVDITAEFFVKVQPNEEDVLAAAASLGDRTLVTQHVSELLEGKLIGALRSVAATMALQELHEKRQEFADAVQQASTEDLKENGFTLETVSVTNLDQTPLDQLNPDNRFDAEAIKTIKGEVEANQTRTKEIEEEQRVKRQEATLMAELGIQEKETEKQKASFNLEQEQAVAEQIKMRAIETSKLLEEQAVKEAAEKQLEAVERARIAQEEAVRQRAIEQEKAIETAEIERKEAIELARVAQEREVETAEIDRKRTIDVTRAESQIAVAEKETAREEAEKLKLVASASRAEAEEKVITAKEVEEANRQKEIALVEAGQLAEAALITEQKRADADIYTITKTAEAKFEAAQNEAEAIKVLAEAELEQAKALAEGKTEMVIAENEIDQRIITKEIVLALVGQLPAITEQLMKPAEQIESIRILDMGGGDGGGIFGNSGFGKVANSIIGAGAALPVLKEMMGATGVDIGDVVDKISSLIPDLGGLLGGEGKTVVVNVGATEEDEPENTGTEDPGKPAAGKSGTTGIS